MKFLIDRCAGHRIAEFLETQGHDVSELSDRGPDPGDRTVLQWAWEENRVLVTMDKDFGKLVYLEGQTHCGLIRLPDIPPFQRIEIMKQLLKDHAAHLAEGCMLTVRGGRIRTSFPRHYHRPK
jgi:predicted nuclease of predicted toxin-antitoxin system